MVGLFDLEWRNTFRVDLPEDSETGSARREVRGAAFSSVEPTRVRGPKLVAASPECAALLGLDAGELRTDDFVQVFAGNGLVPGMKPFAMTYGGHQFGHWAGQLGDGRAINLGEAIGADGLGWTLQLKGAGPTPYSRTADGLAVLRSSVREFLCSEAMHHLGVPTTRALSLVTTGEEVLRDMFYDGNQKLEPGAVVCRVARSFVRFGSFELPASRGEVDLVRQLADHVIRRSYPELDAPPAPAEIPSGVYLAWFEEILRRTATMVAHWTRVGFVHGVMNTDNMSILGETIDYGPYGWLEDYDPDWTPNTTDAEGRRYRFGHQAAIAHWNVTRLASAIVPLVGATEGLQAAVDAFPTLYANAWGEMLAHKLGWERFEPDVDGPLAEELFTMLQATETDMTVFFRRLASTEDAEGAALDDAYYGEASEDARGARSAWLTKYLARADGLGLERAARAERMNRTNPKYVLRNYLAQVAIDAAEKGHGGEVNELLETLRRPYDEQPGRERHAEKRPDWARHRPGCSMLSCSS